MANMIIEVYDALIAAGSPEDKAKAAAKAMAEHEPRMARLESDVGLLKWMVGVNIGLTCAVLVKVFFA